MRRAVIQVLLMLKDTDCNEDIISLLQTIVTISKILYSKDANRTTRQLLQLYNNCWIHMELCTQLFPIPHKLSRSKFFGLYLHALTVHSPDQYELACQCSLNAENQERYFGQARIIAETCTNHHADNVIPQVLLRLHTKQEQKSTLASVQNADSQVKQIAKQLHSIPNTHIRKSFIHHRQSKWQIHLYRISPYIVLGRGVWWSYTSEGFEFFDGDTTTPQSSRPPLLHFRHDSIDTVNERREKSWKQIIKERIPIPAEKITLYDSNGRALGHIVYSEDDTTEFQSLGISTTTAVDPQSTQTVTQSSHTDPLTQSSHTLTDPQSSHTLTDPLTQSSHTLTDPQSSHTRTDPQSSHTLTDPLTQSSHTLTDPQSSDFDSVPFTVIAVYPENSTTNGFKTTLASSIFKVLGDDCRVREFDDLRFSLKNQQSSLDKVKRYETLIAEIGSKLLSERTRLDQEVGSFEHAYFSTHGRLPDHKSDRYKKLLSNRNHIKTLVRYLDIKL